MQKLGATLYYPSGLLIQLVNSRPIIPHISRPIKSSFSIQLQLVLSLFLAFCMFFARSSVTSNQNLSKRIETILGAITSYQFHCFPQIIFYSFCHIAALSLAINAIFGAINGISCAIIPLLQALSIRGITAIKSDSYHFLIAFSCFLIAVHLCGII